MEEKKDEILKAAEKMLEEQGIVEPHDIAFMAQYTDAVTAMIKDAKLEDDVVDEVKSLLDAAIHATTGCDRAWVSKEHRKLSLSQGAASGILGIATTKASGVVQSSSQIAPPPQGAASSNLGGSSIRGKGPLQSSLQIAGLGLEQSRPMRCLWHPWYCRERDKEYWRRFSWARAIFLTDCCTPASLQVHDDRGREQPQAETVGYPTLAYS